MARWIDRDANTVIERLMPDPDAVTDLAMTLSGEDGATTCAGELSGEADPNETSFDPSFGRRGSKIVLAANAFTGVMPKDLDDPDRLPFETPRPERRAAPRAPERSIPIAQAVTDVSGEHRVRRPSPQALIPTQVFSVPRKGRVPKVPDTKILPLPRRRGPLGRTLAALALAGVLSGSAIYFSSIAHASVAHALGER
jgi:hypothetical protein